MDEFHNPRPHKAASKSKVSSVLGFVGNKGLAVIRLLSGLLAATLMLYSGYVLYDTFQTQRQAFSGGWDVLQFKPEIIENGDTPLAVQDRLAAINGDYRAWLTMYDTNIDYPVMQGKDDLYYASHDVYGEPSLHGAIYLAAGNTGDLSDEYNLIYGHHMDNGAMFGGLDEYLKPAYRNQHLQGVLISQRSVYDLEVFAVVETDAYESQVYTVGPGRSVGEVLNFLENPTEKTHVRYYNNAVARSSEKITALSTCASAETNGRLVVFCKTTLRNLITIRLPSYVGVYDGQTHTVQASVNYPEGTIVSYSVDGGVTWSDSLPSILDVGTVNVIARAVHPDYGRATVEATLIVEPCPVTVTAIDSSKTYGTPDPGFDAKVEGLVDDATIAYTVTRPGAGTDENAGTYEDALVPAGQELQGNYIVTYVPADFSISRATMTVAATGYEGNYDGATHSGSATPSVSAGTTIEYSVDGGQTWSTTAPSLKDIGLQQFSVRTVNPNYETATASATLIVHPRPVTVTAVNASKMYGTEDPTFTATVTGTLGNDRVTYTVSRPGEYRDEDVGTYERAIVPTGARNQGNYIVTYVPATFVITGDNTLTVTATGYEGDYDGREHEPQASTNVPGDTTILFSPDGEHWSIDPPTIKDVGTITVYVRATNPNYEPAETTVTLKVNPLEVTVTADNGTKVVGKDDPTFTASVSGVIDDFEIVYTVTRPGAGTDEDVGTYPDAIVPSGEQLQGNYTVTYVPASFVIAPDQMTLTARGYTGVYDGETHGPVVSISVDEGTVVEYSLDGGTTWTTQPPTIRDVGLETVLVRASNPRYETVTEEITLAVTPRQVTVTAAAAEKNEGEEDPTFTASVSGVIDDFEIVYTVTRPGAGRDEAAGTYANAIVPNGETLQGNYAVTFVSAAFTVRGVTPAEPEPSPTPTAPPEDIDIPDDQIPLVDVFNPKGTGSAVWALVNLICMILTIYLLIPLMHLKDKYARKKLLEEINEADNLIINERAAKGEVEAELLEAIETVKKRIKTFLKRLRTGTVLETLTSILAVVAFILTEDMRLPMVLIDKWTPLMVAILLVTWIIDVRLARYRWEKQAEEEAKKEQEKKKRAAKKNAKKA